jgi:MarR family transcriptional regulator, organic hydroperoxide resistance regulator
MITEMKTVSLPSPAELASLKLEEHLCFALYSASIAVGRLYKPLLDQLGVTYPQYLVLRTLSEQDGLTVGAIADRLSLEPSTLTPLLKRLEARGFVDRRRNAANERQVLVSLTDAGRRLDAESACLGALLISASGATPQELRALTLKIGALRDAVDARRAEEIERSWRQAGADAT